MSSLVKERLKRLMLELEHLERVFLDKSLEQLTGKTCDEAIEMLSDKQVRDIVYKIKKRRKKKLEIMEEPIAA